MVSPGLKVAILTFFDGVYGFRYKRHYGLKDETPTKRDLVELVTDHFRAQEMSVSEQETILLFRSVRA